MEIDRKNSKIHYTKKSLVGHGSSALFCVPKSACDWLDIDANSKVDCTLDIINGILIMKKSEVDVHGIESRRADTINARAGSIFASGNTTNQEISKTTTEASTIEPSVDTIDAPIFSTTVEGEEAFEQESEEVLYGTSKKDIPVGSDQGICREGCDPDIEQ